MRASIALLVASIAALPAAQAEWRARAGRRAAADWPMYNRDSAGTRHSPLALINSGNVARLTHAWSYQIGRDRTAGTLSGGSEFTPIVVNGVMYAAGSDRVVALEPETGKEIWRHQMKDGVPSRRGVTYWAGDKAPRIFFTSERRLIALSARTGTVVSAFGRNGEIDMTAPYHSAPTLYKNLLIVGTNGSPGGVRAFDARTGAKVWAFHNWASEGWENRAGVFSWAVSSRRPAASCSSARRTIAGSARSTRRPARNSGPQRST